MTEPVSPLGDILVVSLEQAVSAPLATRHLADLGARVIKIERPDGGDFARSYDHVVAGTSAFFVWCNRSKESVALDLKLPAGRAALEALLDRADVLVTNLAPGALGRLGFDLDMLHQQHEKLVVCEISGYGKGGPYGTRKAYDLLIQAEAGLFEVTGDADLRARVGISIADIAAAMYAFSGVLAALLRRSVSGQGAVVRVSMLEALAEWMTVPVTHSRYSGASPRRTGDRHPTIAPYGVFQAEDGQVMIAVQNEREWTALCDVIGQPSLATDDRYDTNQHRVAHVEELRETLNLAFSATPTAVLEKRLEDAGIAYSRLNDLESVYRHPQLAALDKWQAVGVDDTLVDVLSPPIVIDGLRPHLSRVPRLGEHTDAVLTELGLSGPGGQRPQTPRG